MEFETWNHVVRTHGLFGKWGRGLNMGHALKNGRIRPSEHYTHFVFANDDWDLLEDGTVTWPDGCLISKKEYNRPPAD